MKRLILVFLFLALAAKTVWAQETTSISQAEADYRFQFDLYRTAYQQYLIDKAEYLKSGTLKAEQEALGSAKAVSLARAEVLRTYTQWLRLQLLQYETQYPKAVELSGRLDQLNQWYLTHKTKIEAASDKASFEQVQQEYVDGLDNREKLYLQAQIELKLAKLMSFRLEMIRLYEPLKAKLAPQTGIPEIQQGMTRSEENFATLATRITALSEKVKVLESVDTRRSSNEPTQVRRDATKELESLRDLSLSTINILIELEARYGQ